MTAPGCRTSTGEAHGSEAAVMHRLLQTGLVACAFVAVADSSAQGELVRVDKARSSYSAYGYAIAAPSGDDWYVASQADGHVTAFYRMPSRRDMKKLHSLVAAVPSFWVSGCTDADSCLELAIEELARNEPGSQLVTASLETLEEQTVQSGCLRIKALQHDRRVPDQPGKLFELHIDGMLCSHPSAPNFILNPNFSERVPSGERRFKVSHDDLNRFIQSLEFRPVGPRVDSTLRFMTTVRAIAPGNGGLWVQHGNQLSLVDTDSGDKLRTLDDINATMAMAFAFDSLWLGEYENSRLTRVDPESGEVQARIALPGTPVFVVASTDSLWISHEDSGEVVRVDPATNSIAARVPAGKANAAIVAAFDSVWVSNPDDDSVYRIDVDDNAVRSRVYVCDMPLGLAALDDSVWAGCGNSGTLARIDPSTHRVTDRFTVGGSPFFMDGDKNALWITNQGLGTVSRFDLQSGAVTDIVPIGLAVLFIRVINGTAWVSDYSSGGLFRLVTALPE